MNNLPIVDDSLAPQSRRRWLMTVAQATGTVGGVAVCGVSASAAEAKSVAFGSQAASSLFRVGIEVDVEGNVKLARTGAAEKSAETLLPINGKIKLDYEERFLRPAAASAKSDIVAVERHYHSATGSSTVSRRKVLIELRPEVAVCLARRDELPETIYSPTAWLTHEELDLLRTPISSVSIDQLVPQADWTVGKPLPIETSTLASVFNLSGVAAGDVTVELVDADAQTAKMQVRGRIDGSIHGVPTVLRIVGKLTFDRQARMVTWAAVAIHETREIGKAEPGFDVTATIRMVRQPLPAVQMLSAKPAAIDFDKPVPAQRTLLAVASQYAGAGMLMDRRWRMISDMPGGAVLRMVDTERVIAQCNLRPLAQMETGKQLSLEGFEADIRKSLGKQLGGIMQSQERVTDAGTRVLQITATGEVQGVPIHWMLMHFSDDDGHRVQATLTMDSANVSKLDGSDVQLIETLRLTDPQTAVAGTRDQKKSSEGSVGQLKSGKTSPGSVNSKTGAASQAPTIATSPQSPSQR